MRTFPEIDFSKLIPESRAEGCLIGGAVGDALGRPNEGRTPPKRRISEFEPWPGWRSGPRGTVTDDTQLTMILARSLLSRKGFDAADFAASLAAVSAGIRGMGSATRSFFSLYRSNGGDWRGASQPSSGNGAAMRAAPVGLLAHCGAETLAGIARSQAIVTHDDPMAVASSLAMAYAVARLGRMGEGELDGLDARMAFLAEVAAAIAGIEAGREYLTRKEGKAASLADRLGVELPGLMRRGATLAEIQDEFWSGAYVLESLPLAFAAFLAKPGDFEEVVVEAGCRTKDSDTVASMAGNLAGAYLGLAGIPGRWLPELEFRAELLDLGRALCGIEPGDLAEIPPGRELRSP